MTAHSLVPSTPRGEATRQRVLEAAEQVFGVKGYHGASVTEITRAAGVAQGTFYLYFRGKKEIFLDLVDTLSSRLVAVSREAASSGRDYIERERLGYEAFYDFAASDDQRESGMVMAPSRREPEEISPSAMTNS